MFGTDKRKYADNDIDEFINSGLGNYGAVQSACDGVDTVIHLAPEIDGRSI